jgi:hypothetical protein
MPVAAGLLSLLLHSMSLRPHACLMVDRLRGLHLLEVLEGTPYSDWQSTWIPSLILINKRLEPAFVIESVLCFEPLALGCES